MTSLQDFNVTIWHGRRRHYLRGTSLLIRVASQLTMRWLPHFNVINWERRHFPIRVALQLTVKWFLTLKSFKKSNVITHLSGVTTDSDILSHFISLWSLTKNDVITHSSGVKSDNDIITPHLVITKSDVLAHPRGAATGAVTSLPHCNVISWEWQLTQLTVMS
jgi:hypothetical protein